jgi:hypothetical protein
MSKRNEVPCASEVSAADATTRRRAAELHHEQRNREDIVFLEWLRQVSTPELAGQMPFSVGWQRIAIERELERRDKMRRREPGEGPDR